MKFKVFFSRISIYLRPHLGKLIFASFAMIFATVMETAIPEITGRIVDDLFVENRAKNVAFFYSIVLFGIFLLSAIFNLISASASSWVSTKVISTLREDMFKKLLFFPKNYFDNNTSGSILSKLTFDVEQIANVASTIWLELVKTLLTVLILVIYLFYKNWQLSISLLIILPILAIIVSKSTTRMRSASSNLQAQMGNLTQSLNENIDGNTIVKIYEAQDYEKDKFSNIVNKIRQQRFKLDITAAINSNIVNILLGLCLSFVVYFSSIGLNMTGGEFLSFFTALAMLVKPAKTLIDINKPFQIALAAGKSVFGLIDSEEEKDGKDNIKIPLSGNINFNKVSFSYDGKKSVLNDISFKINAGEKVALVGQTGSGKTTIIELLTKLYYPDSGTIFIDNHNISHLCNKSLRENIAYVDQNTILFNDSFIANISLGPKKKKIFDKVIDAAKKAESFSFIDKLNMKFHSYIGENGKLLSGGQRQRIAIARAIYKDSPILILDEATSALDSKTEKLVQHAIDNMTKNKTTIIIAHRLTTIKNANKIIVLDEGNIVEIGNHNSLLKANGKYAKLIKDQF